GVMGRRMGEIAMGVAESGLEVRERLGEEPAVLRHAVARTGPQLVERPLRLRHADDGHVEMSAAGHRLKGGEDLLVREVTRRAEEDERVGARCGHGFFSTWPPN